MGTIGTLEDAKLIFRRRKSGCGPLPKGWRKLGDGAYRHSYLSPDGVVYKLCHSQDESGRWNCMEYNVYRGFKKSRRKLPPTWRVAETGIHNFEHDGEDIYVIAMEYIQGIHPKVDPDNYDDYFVSISAYSAFEKLGLYDVHEENFVITPTGEKVIIDLGE